METSVRIDAHFGEYVLDVLQHTPNSAAIGIIISIGLLLSGFLYGSHIAYASLSKQHITKLQQAKRRFSQTAFKLSMEPQLLRIQIFILTICIDTIIVVTFFSAIVLHSWQFSANTLGIVGIFLLIYLCICKLFPYALAKRFPLSYSKNSSILLYYILKYTHILYVVLDKLGIVHVLQQENKQTIADDIADALHVSPTSLSEEKDLIESIVKMQNTQVSTIMTPRVDISAIDITMNFTDLLQTIIESGYSRIPVYSQTLDTIQGILYVKDLLPHIQKSQGFRWQSLLRPTYFVPESKKIDTLFEEFQKNKIHLAVVIDEYGGTCGIVTLEDILEIILGEINDEFDDDIAEPFIQVEDNIFLFEGKTSILEVCKALNVSETFFDTLKGDADSLAGLILEMKGDFPELFEEFEYKHLRFKIEAEDDRRIKKISIIISKPLTD